MEDSTRDSEKSEKKEKDQKDREDPVDAIAPAMNIQEERCADVSTTPAVSCLHEVYLFLFIYYYSKTWVISLKIQMKLMSLSK